MTIALCIIALSFFLAAGLVLWLVHHAPEFPPDDGDTL